MYSKFNCEISDCFYNKNINQYREPEEKYTRIFNSSVNVC